MKFLNSIQNLKTIENKYTTSLTYSTESKDASLNDENTFIYFQLQKQLLRIKHHSSDNCKFIKKLVNLNTKRGYKAKALNLFSGILTYIYNYFSYFDDSLNHDYPTYCTFFEFSRAFPEEFYKPDFLVRYVHLYLELVFLIKKIKPKKKLKKKKHVPKVLISYVPKNTRSNITLRIINTYINNSYVFDKSVRLGNSLLYLALSGRNSFLYKKKLNMYSKLLEKKKFY